MNFEDTIKDRLISNGLMPDSAEEIMVAVKNNEANKSMTERWHESVSHYPNIVLTVVWVSAKKHALEWIDDNCPGAWFRPLFESVGK